MQTNPFKLLAEHTARVVESLPCLPLVAGLINGAIFTLEMDSLTLFKGLLLGLPGIALASLLLKRGRALGFAICTLLGLASAQYNEIVPSDDYTRAIGERPACGAIVEATVADESCCGDALPWLPNPKYVRMEALRLQLPGSDEWQKVSGSFAARLPEDVKPEYAAKIRLEGAFLTVETPASEGAFDFGRYLELRSVHRVFDAREASVTGPGEGFMHALFAVRNLALNKLCEGIASDESKRLVAALVFGCQQGVSWENRTDFLKSGTIHILSVSGLHVAMVATILAIALRAVPFRSRHLLIPLLTLLYSLMTGMQAPSFRAFAMLATWSVLRATLLSTNAMNTTLLSAVLLLVWRPSQILDTGFQYSFICVIFLLGSASLFHEWKSCAIECFKWIPPSLLGTYERLRTKLLENIALSLAACVVAWLASCGLSLLYQGLGVPCSIPSNMVLIPITWLIFITFAFQSVLFWIPGFMTLSGALMDFLLKLMNSVCAFFASSGGGHAPMPPVWSVTVFLLLLLAFLTTQNRKAVFWSTAALAAMLSAWTFWGSFEEPSVALLRGGQSQEPSVVICEPRSDYVLAVNVPDFDAARQIYTHLNSQGMAKIDTLLLSSAGKEYCGGAKFLLGFLKIDRIGAPKFSQQAISATETLEMSKTKGVEMLTLQNSGGIHSLNDPLLKASLKKSEWTVECRHPGINIVVQLSDSGNGSRTFLIKGLDGETLASESFSNSLRRELRIYRLRRQ